MKIPFDFSIWEKDKHQAIETRDGRRAFYIGADRAGWQVFEVETGNGSWEYLTYHYHFKYNAPDEGPNDLFLLDEKQLAFSDFEKYVDGIIDESVREGIGVKRAAKDLLALARKESGNNFTDSPGEYVRYYLKKNRLNQRALSRLSGLNCSVISGIIKGIRPVSPTSAIKLSEVLKCDPYELGRLNSDWVIKQKKMEENK